LFDFIVNVIIVTFFLVLFGEAIPKVYATHNKLPIARSVSGLFTFLNKLLSPINYLLVNSTAVIEKRIKRHNAEIDIDEINKAIDITVDNKASKNDVKMLKGIVHFGNITVRQVMRPRMDVAAADVEWDFLKLISFVKENGYSRLPVFKESIDNIQGVLYIKDLLEHIHQGKDFQWQKLIREALHTPETKKIDDLLREFQETRKHLAIVVDEFGGTSGIVTLEDIVEEVIGDINDESDESADSQLRKNPDGSYIVEGIMQLGDLAKGLELENDYFEEAKGDAETVGGLVVELFGRIPKVGEEVVLHNFKFKVLSFKKNRIEKLKIFNNTPQS
jgi:putative hemolysin